MAFVQNHRIVNQNPMQSGSMDRYQMLGQLVSQIEYYFSWENLSNDYYLVSQMDSEYCVPVETIARFKMVQALTMDIQDVREAMKLSKLITLSKDETKARPAYQTDRCTILLRDISSDTDPEVVRSIFTRHGDKCAPIVHIRSDIGNLWYITFNSEAECTSTVLFIRSQTFNGQPIRCGVKSESPLKSLVNLVKSSPKPRPPPQQPEFYYIPPVQLQFPVPETFYSEVKQEPKQKQKSKPRPKSRGKQAKDKQKMNITIADPIPLDTNNFPSLPSSKASIPTATATSPYGGKSLRDIVSSSPSDRSSSPVGTAPPSDVDRFVPEIVQEEAKKEPLKSKSEKEKEKEGVASKSTRKSKSRGKRAKGKNKEEKAKEDSSEHSNQVDEEIVATPLVEREFFPPLQDGSSRPTSTEVSPSKGKSFSYADILKTK